MWMAHRPSLPAGIPPVPSALECFTTRFGMGRGGSTPLLARQWFRVDNHHRARPIETWSSMSQIFHQGSPQPCAPVASICRHTSSSGRSPSSLLGALPDYISEYTHLGGYFPLRCFQRFLRPDVDTEPAGRPTTPPPAVRPIRSSRTKISSPQYTNRSQRIETELSHDVLNPARVPL